MVTTLDLTSFPTARNDATEDLWSKYSKGISRTGIIWGIGNTFETYGHSTGLFVKVKSGRALINGVCCDSASQNTFAIATAHVTNPRIDNVVLRLTTTSPATIACKVISGTPSPSPTAPALLDDATHTDLLLARVNVAALAPTISAADVTATPLYTGDTGWFDITSTPTVAAGSSFTIAAWTQDLARARFDGMTCHFYVNGQIALSGSNPGGLIMPLPIRATNQNTPINAYVSNDLQRAKITFDSFQATILDIYPVGSNTWPTDGVPRELGISGTYEIYRASFLV